MIKIVKTGCGDSTTYQVVDEAYEDIPENRGKPAPTILEAVNSWLYPNNDESGVAKFLAEIPIEEGATPEPIVGVIPSGNIINMVMAINHMRPATYHSLVDWCMEILDYESSTDSSIPHVGYDVLDEAFVNELNSRVQKINEPLLLLKLIEVAKSGIRGCNRDRYNDNIAKAIQNACMGRLADFQDSLPPSLWHTVHRHQLWLDGAETEVVSLPSPDGWVSISGFREPQHGGWKVKMQVGSNAYESPQYVRKMGLKARHDGYAKGSHSGVEVKAYHLFNYDGSLWGFEVYLISPLKTVGCEVTTDGRFSLFRKGVYLPPRSHIRQGDMLLEKMEYNGIPTEHKHPKYDYWHPISRVHSEETVQPVETKNPVVREWKSEPIQLPRELHSVTFHPVDSVTFTKDREIVKLSPIPLSEDEQNRQWVEPVLVISQPTVLRHEDHPSILLEAGYYLVRPVEGETDYQPRQRRGD